MTAKFLGIDYGDKNIGLALGSLGSIAVPYKILLNTDLGKVIGDLEKIIKDENISGLVIGLPTSLSGRKNERVEITEHFISYCRQYSSVPVHVVDESFTSQLYTKQGIHKDIDKYAATAILETFLAHNEPKL